MGRLLLLLLIVGVLSACGASGQIYAAAKTRSCLAAHGARIGPASDDLVASTATGGAFRAYLVGNFVTVVFGATVADAKNVDDAYRSDSVEREWSKAEVDGYAAALLLGKPVGVNARQRLDESGLAVIDVAGGSDYHAADQRSCSHTA